MKKFILIHQRCESNSYSVVAFSDSYRELEDVSMSQPHFGSSRHKFYICFNKYYGVIRDVKDEALINICKNVAEYLAVGEYAMLKKSYFKSQAWFEKAKNCAFLGADILDNY